MYKTALLSACLVSGLFASHLDYFSDEAHYFPDRYDGFAGFGTQIKARCEGGDVLLVPKEKAPEDASLADAYGRFEAVRMQKKQLGFERKMLEQAVSSMEYKNAEAQQIIDNAKALAARTAELEAREAIVGPAYDAAKRTLEHAGLQASSMPMYLSEPCKAPELVIPSYTLSIRPGYRAAVDENERKITVEETLKIRNKSGVDIKAETGTFYTYALHQPLRKLTFSPWVINRTPRPVLYKARTRAIEADAVQPVAAAAAPSAERVNTKKYVLKNLDLPANGRDVEVPVSKTALPVETERIVYPFLDARVFETYVFEPLFKIQNGAWKVTAGDTVSERAFGVYEGKRYRLYAAVDRDVSVKRQRDIHSDSHGFFSGAKIEDGYTIELANLSDTLKRLQIVDRIPVSTTDKIEVTDVHISPSDIPHKREKRGKLVFNVTLLPHATRTIHVGFTVKHDTDVPVRY